MRLTIVDPARFVVVDVMEQYEPVWVLLVLIHCAPDADDTKWFVTAYGCQPEHAQHNRHGQIVGRYDRVPRLRWSA